MIHDISVGFDLVMPSPLQLKTGTYTGEVIYKRGDGHDIYISGKSFGMSDDEVKFNITADVFHLLHVRFPEEVNNINLSPKEGWAQWQNGGRIPQSLSKEVPFVLNASTKFSVTMLCLIPSGDKCGLSNNGEVVPVNVNLTMPGLVSQGVNADKISLTTERPVFFEVHENNNNAIFDRISKVSFDIGKNGVETMVKSPGSTWKGSVSLVFDADLE